MDSQISRCVNCFLTLVSHTFIRSNHFHMCVLQWERGREKEIDHVFLLCVTFVVVSGPAGEINKLIVSDSIEGEEG